MENSKRRKTIPVIDHVYQEDEQKRRFLGINMLCTFVLSIIYYFFLVYINYEVGQYLMIFFMCSHILFFWGLYKQVSSSIIGNLFSFISFSIFLVFIYTSGGVASAAISWYLATLISAFWFANKQSGYFWASLSIITVVFFLFSETYGFSYPIEYPLKYHYLFTGVAFLGVLTYYLIVIHTYERWQFVTHSKLMNQNEEILEMSMELEQLKKEPAVNLQKERGKEALIQRLYSIMMEKMEKETEELKGGFLFHNPKEAESNHFYWYRCVEGGMDCLVVGRCRGAGAEATLQAVIAHYLLDRIVREGVFDKPTKLIEALMQEMNQHFANSSPDHEKEGMDVGILMIDRKEGRGKYCGVGVPLYQVQEDKMTVIRGEEKNEGLEDYCWNVDVDDHYYIVSERISNEESKGYQKKQIAFFQKLSKQPMEEQLKLMIHESEKRKENQPQIEDIVVAGVRPQLSLKALQV